MRNCLERPRRIRTWSAGFEQETLAKPFIGLFEQLLVQLTLQLRAVPVGTPVPVEDAPARRGSVTRPVTSRGRATRRAGCGVRRQSVPGTASFPLPVWPRLLAPDGAIRTWRLREGFAKRDRATGVPKFSPQSLRQGIPVLTINWRSFPNRSLDERRSAVTAEKE
jgi:hypothetical protein